jgi:threonine dehydratase
MVTLEDIRQAGADLPDWVIRTPLLRALEWPEGLVWVKPENLQTTGSYKLRAAFTMLNRLPEEQKRRGAAISSSGNFAGAWAYSGSRLGVLAAVVMQEKTSPYKVEKTRRYGGEVVLCPNDFEARWTTLDGLERDRGIRAINTFESADVIAGHGTIGLEILADLPDVDHILVPVSSGGLIAGVATAAKALRPEVQIHGVQPEGSHAVTTSFQRGEVTRIDRVDTICDALIAQYPGALPFEHIQTYVDSMTLVPDAEVKQAIRWLVDRTKLVVEAGGAVCAAALLSGRLSLTGKVVVLLSGGNIHPDTLAGYLEAGS